MNQRGSLGNRLTGLLVSLAMGGLVSSAHHDLTFVVEERSIAPDNFNQMGLTINGQFPGPNINVTMGDSIRVKLVNKVARPMALHWHGINQKGSNSADGIVNVTQDQVAPSVGEYSYEFTVPNQMGTFWYHATTGVDSEFVYGGLVVMESPEVKQAMLKASPKYDYDEDELVLLSERWHATSADILEGITSTPFRSMGPPQSILTNGHSFKSWAQPAEPTAPFNAGYNVLKVKPDHRYRLRLVGANGHSMLSFRIPDHTFTVIEVDGTLVDPVEADHVQVNAGQRISVILKANQSPSVYPVYTQIIGRGKETNTGYSILQYTAADSNNDATVQALLKQEVTLPRPLDETRWIEDRLLTNTALYRALSPLDVNYYPVPSATDKEFILNVRAKSVDGVPKFLINDELLPANVNLANKENLSQLNNVFTVSQGDRVQLIFQLFSVPNKPCMREPWHLHGHSFHVVGHGPGTYDPATDGPRLATVDSATLFRDTFNQFPATTPQLGEAQPISNNIGETNCGWYAIRFVANNPGLWLLESMITAYKVRGLQGLLNVVPK